MDIWTLWHDNISIKWWSMLLIGFFFLALNTCIFLAMWYFRRCVAVEYGYPKRNKKTMKKKMASYKMVEKLLLLRLTLEAENKGVLLCINIVCHFINIAALSVSIFGFCCCMVTLADGWCLTLLVTSELIALVFTIAIEFIPHLIWLPSERKRYYT